MLEGLPDLAWSSSFLQHEWNFLSHLVTVLWPTASLLFAQQMFLVTSTALWPSSNSSSISSRIIFRYRFICATFKSYKDWSHAQRVSAPITTILPMKADICAANKQVYQNLAKTFNLPQYHWEILTYTTRQKYLSIRNILLFLILKVLSLMT